MMIRSILVIIVALALTGCGGSRNWREEVLLADGKTVVVERWAKLGNPLDQEIPDIKSGPPTIGYGMRIPRSGQQSAVSWETDRTLTPLAIGLRGENIYLAASPRFCWAYDQLGRPVPPYVFFKHDGKEWQRIPVEEFPEEISTTNLLVAARPQDVESGVVKAEFIANRNRHLSPDLRTIYRSGVRGQEQCIKELNAGWHSWHKNRDEK